MSGPFYYFNTLGNKVSTTSAIDFCRKVGPQSFCQAFSIPDQHGCMYREDPIHSSVDACMYYRSSMDGACDSVWAHTGKKNPNPHKKKEK